MRITRLKLQNWRNFKQAEVHREARAFFVGPNASGKSNLLNALKFLRDLVSLGLQNAVEDSGGVSEIRSFSAGKVPHVLIEIDLGTDIQPKAWTYSLEFTAEKGSGKPVILQEAVRKANEWVLQRPESADEADPARLSETSLESVNANRKFREIADQLRSISYLHIVPQIVRDSKRSSGRNDPYGGDLIERINTTPQRKRDARLKRMEEALRIAVPQLRNLELEIDKKGVPHLRAQYVHWRPQGAWQRQEHFSDGTLRLLGLIWSLQESGGPLLLEEPEMSLNIGVVSRLAPMIARVARRSGRQAIVTTHSADLLSDGVSLAEVHLLEVGDQGTKIVSGQKLDDVFRLVEGGVPVGDAIMPKAKARDLEQLAQLDLFSA